MPKENPHRSQARDKPKHSRRGLPNAQGAVKKGGAGARGWGAPADDVKYLNDSPYLDENDPNFDPVEADMNNTPIPSSEVQAQFVASAVDLKNYKREIKSALAEYLANDDPVEFTRLVVELDMTVYHQELTKIIVSKGLDYPPEKRAKLSSLLAHLHTEGHLTAAQAKAGFQKIYNNLDEVLIDAPNAQAVLREFAEHAVSNGFLESGDMGDFAAEEKFHADVEGLAALKTQVKTLVREYLVSEDVSDLCQSIEELKAPKVGHEVIKRLVYSACDGGARAKEVASRFIAQVPSSVIAPAQREKGFAILLERTEDMYLDTPDILFILSAFIARAIKDEAVAPAFLVRQDLEQGDMGFQVVTQAERLVKQRGSSSMLANVWIDVDEE